MKIGDLVYCYPTGTKDTSYRTQGVIVGFNDKGEGGKDFIHVLVEGKVCLFMFFDVEVIL